MEAARWEEDMDVDPQPSDLSNMRKSNAISYDPKQMNVEFVYECVDITHQWKITDLVYHLIGHFCKPEKETLRQKYVVISPIIGIRITSYDRQIVSDICLTVKCIEKKLSNLWYVEMSDDLSTELSKFSVRAEALTDASCLVLMPYTSQHKRVCVFSESRTALRRCYEAIIDEFKQRRSIHNSTPPTTFISGVSTNQTASETGMMSYPHPVPNKTTSGTGTVSYPHPVPNKTTSGTGIMSYPHPVSNQTASGTGTRYSHTHSRLANEESEMEFKVQTLKVKIYQSSILDVRVDTIVNAADECLTNGSGVSKAIDEAGGYEYWKGCQKLLESHGPTLKNFEVYESRPGRLKDKFQVILHAIGPRWIDYEDKEQCLLLLVETVKNVLKMADSLYTTSLAMPAISSGRYGVPVELCAACYILGIFSFSQDYFPMNLKEVHLVDRDPKVVQELCLASSEFQKNQKLMSFSAMKVSYPQHFGNAKQTVAKGTSQSKGTASRLQPLDFKIGKIKVRVYQGSILNVKADAVVNAANEALSHGAGVALAISQAAGEAFDKDCQRKLQSLQRSLKPTEVLETVPGNLRNNFRCILNAVGPMWSKYLDKTHCLSDLQKTIKNIMDKAEELYFKSLAMPAISSSIFGVPLKLCAEMYLLGILEFSRQKPLWVKEVHIVDIDVNVLAELTSAYQQYKKDPLSIDLSSAKVRHPELMRASTSSTVKGNTGSTDSSRRRFRNENETSAERRDHVKDPKTSKQSSWKNIWKHDDEKFGRQLAKVFSFQDTMVIKIYTGSIVRFEGDAIICSNDDRMSGIGPLAKAVEAAGGSKYSESYSKVRSKYLYGASRMTVRAGDVETISGGDLDVGFVVHAVMNSLSDTSRESLRSYKETMKKVFCTINSYNRSKKFAMPLIGAGYVEQRSEELQKCCGALFEVLGEFCRDHQSSCQIKELHLINKNQKVTDALVDLFTCNVSKPSASAAQVRVDDTTPAGFDETVQKRHFHRQHSWSNTNHGGEASSKSGDFKGTGARPKTTAERSKSMYARKPNAEMVKTKWHNQDIDDLIAKSSISNDPDGNREVAEKKAGGNLVIIGLDDDDEDDDDVRKEEQSDEEKTTTCVICLDDIKNGTKLVCGHEFCKGCLTMSFTKHKQACPVCGKIFGEITGNQPPGEMTTEKDPRSLPGYERYGTITVKYIFKSGTQGPEHPNPGEPYEGTERRGFLPDNKEGRKVLKLLEKAFERRLTFTIGYSRTTGKDNVVTWNDIHHKTKRDTGAQRFGYPDPTYLQRVQEELAAKGVTAD